MADRHFDRRALVIDSGHRWFMPHGLPVGVEVELRGRRGGVVEVYFAGRITACAPQSLHALDEAARALLASPTRS